MCLQCKVKDHFRKCCPELQTDGKTARGSDEHNVIESGGGELFTLGLVGGAPDVGVIMDWGHGDLSLLKGVTTLSITC